MAAARRLWRAVRAELPAAEAGPCRELLATLAGLYASSSSCWWFSAPGLLRVEPLERSGCRAQRPGTPPEAFFLGTAQAMTARSGRITCFPCLE